MVGSRRAYKGIALEGVIASWFNKSSAKRRSFEEHATRVVTRLWPDGSILEVAPGRGSFAIELKRLGVAREAGLEISRSFVRIAGENALFAGVSFGFSHGDTAHMPYPGNEFDYIVCSAAFKIFTDPFGSIDEMYRAPGAPSWWCSIDLRPAKRCVS